MIVLLAVIQTKVASVPCDGVAERAGVCSLLVVDVSLDVNALFGAVNHAERFGDQDVVGTIFQTEILLDAAALNVRAWTQIQCTLQQQREVKGRRLLAEVFLDLQQIGATDEILELPNAQVCHDLTNLKRHKRHGKDELKLDFVCSK